MRDLRLLLKLCALALLMTFTLCAAIKLKKVGERKPASNFELKDREGKTVKLSDYAGRVVLIDFWATWCAPCKASMPWMVELSEKYRDAGLTVIGLSMDEDGWEAVTPFLNKFKITYPILLSNPRVAYLYGDVDSLPVAFFVDRNQRVAAIHSGAGSRKEFEKTIQALLE